MHREAMEDLRKWAASPRRKPLVVTGARQVGKTWLVLEFGRGYFDAVAHVTFLDNEVMKSVFAGSLEPDRLLAAISAYTGTDASNGKTLVFLDEIQECPRAIASLKRFCEDRPDVPVVAAGSLLGVAMNRSSSARDESERVSWPVGKVDYLDMHPMTFREFVEAVGQPQLARLLRADSLELASAMGEKYDDLLRTYLFTGGMPEAVSNFADNSNLNDVMRIHRDILSQYKLDFTQYETEDKHLLLTNAYELIPAELLKQNRRYIVTDLKKGLHFERVQSTFLWLKNAGVALSVFNSTEPRIPLKLNEKSSLFKLYFADVGMLTSEYGMNTKSMLLTKNQNLNAGGIYENAIAQELYSKGFRLYYYNSNRLGELDFVIEYNNRALPIEVKSGKDYTIHSAMNNCLANSEYQMQEGIVFANCNVSRKGKVTYLPIYMVMFLQQDSEQIVLDKIEF